MRSLQLFDVKTISLSGRDRRRDSVGDSYLKQGCGSQKQLLPTWEGVDWRGFECSYREGWGNNVVCAYLSREELTSGGILGLDMRKLCVFASHHQFQVDPLMDSTYDQHLRELIHRHNVDVILEEATGLPPKSCVEVLADELHIRWMNVDLSKEQRKLVPEDALTKMYDTFQDLSVHRQRESVWVARISREVTHSGLLVCGMCHVFSLCERFQFLDFEIEAHVYDPRRIYDWEGRRTVSSKSPT
jgi:hypothetical protein